MTKNTNNLPYFKSKHNTLANQGSAERSKAGSYFKIKRETKEKTLADFLLRKFRPRIKKKFPQHFLIQPIPLKTLEFIREKSKKYPHFLRFDIRLYYPSINHQILLQKLPEIAGNPSRRFKKYLKNEIPEFLSYSPYQKGLSIGSPLSYALAGIFLLDLDFNLKNPFLRQTDDYLIFCKNKKEPALLLKNTILPKLNELGLEINERKLGSGRFHKDRVGFIGFDFYAGYFTVQEEKIEAFKKKISKLTYLTKRKPEKVIIKSLNNQILGFGHYYKFTECKKAFMDLDAFIRMRLRRYLSRHKDNKNRQGNLLLTNEVLKNLGLKSLLEIKEKYAPKTKHIFRKTAPKKRKTGLCFPGGSTSALAGLLGEKSHQYEQKLILEELRKLTGLVRKLEKKVEKIHQALAE